ncbi:MAG: Maf family protein [Microbacteriaceae bacterium]|nr:Maf family protein [Microbacteriaceae bacterium]MCI1206989.1 Maf family protein [Microbacteriaceae bacterium]
MEDSTFPEPRPGTSTESGGRGEPAARPNSTDKAPVSLCLASASPSRARVLEAAGLHPSLRASDLPEGALIRAEEARLGHPLALDDLVLFLARAKAEAVAARLVGEGFRGLVLGCDSNFGLGDVSYGKPHTAEVARSRWRAMSGREGRLASGHWLVDVRSGSPDRAPATGAVDVSRLWFSEVSDAEIEAYVASGEPLEVAGGFTLEGRASAFIRRVDGSPSGILGVSVPLVRELSARLGVSWPRLCAGPRPRE